jgi:hypothetical protein
MRVHLAFYLLQLHYNENHMKTWWTKYRTREQDISEGCQLNPKKIIAAKSWTGIIKINKNIHEYKLD